jgi:hypothetical protein
VTSFVVLVGIKRLVVLKELQHVAMVSFGVSGGVGKWYGFSGFSVDGSKFAF